MALVFGVKKLDLKTKSTKQNKCFSEEAGSSWKVGVANYLVRVHVLLRQFNLFNGFLAYQVSRQVEIKINLYTSL